MKRNRLQAPAGPIVFIAMLCILVGAVAGGWTSFSVSAADPAAPYLKTPPPSPDPVFLPAVIAPRSTPSPEAIVIEVHCYGFPQVSEPDWYWQGCVEDETIYEIQRINVSFTQAWHALVLGASQFSLEVDARLVQGSADYRIFFDGIDYKGFYAFGVDPTNGSYAIWRVDGEVTWVPLIDWTPSAHIRPGNEVNRLKVERNGAQISAYVNDQFLDSVSDDTYIDGYTWGLYTRNSVPNSILHFSNMSIIRPQPPTPTPTPTLGPTTNEVPCTAWPQTTSAHCTDDNTAYEIQRTAPIMATATFPGTIPNTIPNYSIEADTYLVEGSGAHGFMFNRYFGSSPIYFAVNPVDGAYAVWEQGEEPSWLQSSHINQGGEGNRIKILHASGAVTFYVNEQALAELNGDRWTDTAWGVFNIGGATSSTTHVRSVKLTNLR